MISYFFVVVFFLSKIITLPDEPPEDANGVSVFILWKHFLDMLTHLRKSNAVVSASDVTHTNR